MLVLNNLPNVQILNGRSTKDEDDDEDAEGEGEYGETNENEEDNQGNIFHNENINTLNNRNSHLYPQMEEIEEDKNLENNYISETNNNENNDNNNNENMDNNNDKNNNIDSNNNNDTNNGKNIKDIDLYGENEEEKEKEKINWTNKENTKEKKLTRNINTLNEKDLNKKIDSNNDDLFKPNSLLYDKIISDNSNKKIDNSNNEEKNDDININIDNINGNDNNNKQMILKESEPLFDLNNSKNSKNSKTEKSNYLIDITNEELNSIKEEKYNKNSEFFNFIIEFCNLLNNNEENSDGQRLQNNYSDKLNSIEEKKSDIPNYFYFYLLYKKKIKIIQNMYGEIMPYIINKCPELNKDNVLVRLNDELFNTIKDSKELISTLHSHIELYNENKNNEEKNKNENNTKENNTNENNLNEIIKEKDNKISSLEQLKLKLLQNLEDDKSTYEKKIENLEKENKIMTERIFTKANNMINSTVVDTQATYPGTDRYLAKSNNNNNKKFVFNNEILNTNFINHYNPINTSRSPIKLTENTNTENNNTINYLNTHGNLGNINNNNRQQLITLKTLKDFINELYLSKSQYDIKCTQNKLPKETLEEYMYTFLNKKYGLKTLIIEWAKNIIAGIKYYSKKDSIVLLFGKIMRNEQEEDARFIIQKVSESIEELLLYYIKRQNPLKLVNEIKKIFEKKKKSELFEEEWKGIIYSIYEKQEAEEIEKKIINYINKENERKKMEMFQKYKNSRVSNQNKNKITNNNINTNNSYYLNTINSFNNISNNNNNNTNSSYMNTIGNINTNNKLSRVEKYNMLLFSEDKNILFTDFIKIVLDNHIKFRDKQLKNFVTLFKSVDTNKDGIINEEEFSELIHKMKIFKEDEVENKIFQFLEKIDPFDNQKFTFSECVNFFSSEIIKDIDINGEEKEISILEKICLKEKTNENVDVNVNGNNEINNINNNNEINENEQVLNPGIDSNNNINNSNKNNNNNNDK